MNLGAAQFSSQELAAARTTFSRLIDEIATRDRNGNREWILLADVYWRRSLTRMLMAEAASDDRERASTYDAARSDLSQALEIFGRFPAEARDRPLVVTQARLLLADGDYQRALSELDAVATRSEETLLLRSLGRVCTGHASVSVVSVVSSEAEVAARLTTPHLLRHAPPPAPATASAMR